MDNDTPDKNGGEASKPLSETKVVNTPEVKVKTDADIFNDSMRSIRNGLNGKPDTLTEEKVAPVVNDTSSDKNAVADNKNVEDKTKHGKNDKDNKGFQGKINGLTRKISERDKRIEFLEKENANLKSAQGKTRDDYSNDAEYIKDLAQHKANETFLNYQLEMEKNQKLKEEQEMFQERVNQQVDQPEVFNARIQKYIDYVDADTEEYCMSSDVGLKMLDIIFDNFEKSPQMLADFVKMPKIKRGNILIALERSLLESGNKQTEPQVEPSVSKAPVSIAPVKGDKLPVEPNTDDEKFNSALRDIRKKYRR